MGQGFSERVRLVYKSSADSSSEVELPFRVLVLGDFSLAGERDGIDEDCHHELTAGNLDGLISKLKPCLMFSVANHLISDGEETLTLQLRFTRMADFHPDAMLKQIPAVNALLDLRAQLAAAQDGGGDREFLALTDTVRTLLGGKLGDDGFSGPAELSYWITEIDRRLSRQLEAILNHERWRSLESAWRALAFLLDRTDYQENCRLSVLDVNMAALRADFEDCAEITQSGLYQRVYTEEFGQFGGRPYAVMIANYEFGPGAGDVWLMQQLASVAAMAHAPFVAAASAAFFDIDDYSGLAKLRDLRAHFQQPKFAKWNSFRESEDARYFALTLPGFLLRPSYYSGDEDIASFDYVAASRQRALWGNSAFAFATRLTDSFAKYRWCASITGKQDGRVEGLAVNSEAQGLGKALIPTEILITDRRESELIEFGFMPLTVHKGDDSAAFYSSRSVQAYKSIANSTADLSYKLGSELAYLLIVSRFSHYLKVMQREHIGSWKNKIEVERELNDWLKQFVSDMDNPAPAVRARRPLRRARIKVEELDGKNDWYFINLTITPHLKYMGSLFSLSDKGKLEKN